MSKWMYVCIVEDGTHRGVAIADDDIQLKVGDLCDVGGRMCKIANVFYTHSESELLSFLDDYVKPDVIGDVYSLKRKATV